MNCKMYRFLWYKTCLTQLFVPSDILKYVLVPNILFPPFKQTSQKPAHLFEKKHPNQLVLD